ncbi:hypothetical protein RJ640_011969 [Escallonia rubra]|uniref:Cytochrome P450 n=1 Tax=Escallonia rubra TaxID=112253 RepID=A0AA88RNC6_9ASTE|nr:hypothetical protein RJ640_011969 [Escallonia rubra]
MVAKVAKLYVSPGMDLFFSALYLSEFFCIYLLVVFLFRRHKPNHPRLPHGRTGWPLIGETLAFVSSGWNGRPEKFIAERMNRYSPKIFKTSLAGEKMAVFCGASGNKFLFSNENKLVVSWWPPTIQKITIGSNSTSVEGTKKMRGIIMEFLKPEALQKYVPVIACMARQHLTINWNTSNGQVKAFPLSRKLTFALACRLFMTVEDPKHVAKFEKQFELVTAGLLSVPVNVPGTAFNRAIKAANHIRHELSFIIEERRKQLLEKKQMETARDLLSHMLLAIDEGGQHLTELEIGDMILGVLLASHDTISSVITFTIYYLADHPKVYAQVLKEHLEIASSKQPEDSLSWEDIHKMNYSRNVINEVLRLAPPSQGAFKEAIKDFTYAGFDIPKGWKTFWSVYSTHKDPNCFPNPEKFDPSRFEGNGPKPFTFVPFGGGPRMCPGSELARLEILIFVHSLVTKFRWEKLIPDEKIVYSPSPMPVNGLPIRLSPRD